VTRNVCSTIAARLFSGALPAQLKPCPCHKAFRLSFSASCNVVLIQISIFATNTFEPRRRKEIEIQVYPDSNLLHQSDSDELKD
jgi:hypothetical protein